MCHATLASFNALVNERLAVMRDRRRLMHELDDGLTAACEPVTPTLVPAVPATHKHVLGDVAKANRDRTGSIGRVQRAVLDGDLRGRVIEVAGARNLTFNRLAALVRQARGTSERVRHIPRPVLRLAAPFSRQVRAALAMDTIDISFNRPRPHPEEPALTEPREALARR